MSGQLEEAKVAPAARTRRRVLTIGLGVAAAAALVAAGIVAVARATRDGTPPASTAHVVTAAVVRTDLATTTQVTGALGFAGAVTVVGAGTGSAFTWLPSPHTVIRRGRRLYEVDGRAVPLFFGRRPAWRTLALGVVPGRDIAQLEANLVRLGYADRSVVTIDRHFTWQTAAAVRRWQTAAGVTATGAVAPGDIAYAPGPVRVGHVAARLGTAPQPGQPILTATTTVRQVRAPLPVTLGYLVHRGDPVTVTLPDGTTTARGVITSVGRVATPGQSGDAGGGGGGQGAPGATPATVTLLVRLRDARAGRSVDAAPVTIDITSARARHVLAVPVSALVALAGGGYAVEVVDARGRRLVPVRTGLFADTRVQVDGAGLAPGTRVEVPAS
ncbi:MAG TPA: peptidoglycan-binding domain-containing protein [Baekduia sp.]|uniref:peptidoglycan-binding domain-containing protein n=1 Tax=Baekduia sp. TaxID=2600305 RepID=UPI002C8B1FA0|nr:peptidoglycan-binding domain-containing protein [Baekduia sp.]HMJ37865.1 peptidoglycan-binding domain-containing protein [Baekduia sp.]